MEIVNSALSSYLQVPDFPFDHKRGTHDVLFSNVIYIDRKDFRLDDSKDYFGLAPNKEVHLKYAYNIRCLGYTSNKEGEVDCISASVDLENKKKCKGNIGWVAQASSGQILSVELRHYGSLFQLKNKDDQDWIGDLNPSSLEILSAYADASLARAEVGQKYQFERLGYYVVDRDSTKDHLVFNRTVSLKV